MTKNACSSIKFIVDLDEDDEDNEEEKYKQDMHQLILQNKNKPYISEEIITAIFLYYDLQQMIQITDKHFIAKTTIKSLLKMPILNWSMNRPPDELRYCEIGEYYINEKISPDSELYLNFNNKKGQVFEIYDGSHRWSALQAIVCGDLDSCPNSFSEWLQTREIMLNIRFNTCEEDVIKAFKMLNKSIPVPDLYIRNAPLEKRNTVEKIVNEWTVRYPANFSASNSPNKGNTNRDTFIGFVESVYDKEILEDLLRERLNNMNEWAKNNISTKIMKSAKTAIKRCEKSGCYLFLHNLDVLLYSECSYN